MKKLDDAMNCRTLYHTYGNREKVISPVWTYLMYICGVRENAESERWCVQLAQILLHTYARWMRTKFQIAHFRSPSDGQSGRGGAKIWCKTYKPTTVTITTRVENATLSLRSGEENHRENWAITRPVSKPWKNRPTIPGPRTSA